MHIIHTAKMIWKAANLSIMNRDRPPLPLLLYDGDCPYCNGAVWWLMGRLGDEPLFFAPLQAPHVQPLLQSRGLPADYADSVLLITEEQTLAGMAAVSAVLRRLPFPWGGLGRLLDALPASLGRWLYQQVAQSSIRLRSKGKACRWPSPQEQKRFWL